MKIALAQQNYHIGNFGGNTAKIIEGIQKAKKENADLVVFSELSVCGYPPRDFLEFEDFINKCYEAIDTIKQYADSIGVIVGCPQRNSSQEGKGLFNAALLLYEKQIKGAAYKTCLPTYDVFDEYRYFEPGFEWNVIAFKGKKIALTICEDIWTFGDNPLYRHWPMEELSKQAPDLMINISASPFDYDHDKDRKEIVKANVLKYKLPMFYCNAIGSQTEVVFDGGSLVYDANGNLIKEMKYFEEDFCVIEPLVFGQRSAEENRLQAADDQRLFSKEIRVSKQNDASKIISYLTTENNIRQIHGALMLGIRDYFSKMNFTKAILGSSGGIDSAVALALACEALGKESVRAILMPSQYSSSHSVSDAEQLSKNLGNPYDVIAIKNIYDSFLAALEPVFKKLPFSLAEENIQSRARGNLLMAIANKFGYILLNTSNKSELATGYGTLYGDMAGGLSVLGDVYKMQVYALAKYINRNGEIIPQNIINKAPSAELRPNQKDSDSLPEYDVLDKILYQYIEKHQGPKEIISMGIDEQLVKRILKLVNTNEYKRNQFCPIIRVSCKAFGVGRRMPIVGKYLS
ncbi:MAG: NAD+ synthase [Bacteroidetes bacterium]|nr:NAD+ synthase [Bacteroidota bacterium]MBS1974775.1 NAD+ synthase [Bacteroidota bacterium]